MTDKKIEKIIFDSGEMQKAKIVVSNADTTQIFLPVIKGITCLEKILVNKLCCSHSLFALYVSTDKDLKISNNELYNIWNFYIYKIERCISKIILTGNLLFYIISFLSAHASVLKNKEKIQFNFFNY